MKRLVKFTQFLLILLGLNSCLWKSGSEDSANFSFADGNGSVRPKDTEGIPGYIIRPLYVELFQTDPDIIRIAGHEGAVQGSVSSPLSVEAIHVSESDLSEILLFYLSKAIDADENEQVTPGELDTVRAYVAENLGASQIDAAYVPSWDPNQSGTFESEDLGFLVEEGLPENLHSDELFHGKLLESGPVSDTGVFDISFESIDSRYVILAFKTQDSLAERPQGTFSLRRERLVLVDLETNKLVALIEYGQIKIFSSTENNILVEPPPSADKVNRVDVHFQFESFRDQVVRNSCSVPTPVNLHVLFVLEQNGKLTKVQDDRGGVTNFKLAEKTYSFALESTGTAVLKGYVQYQDRCRREAGDLEGGLNPRVRLPFKRVQINPDGAYRNIQFHVADPPFQF